MGRLIVILAVTVATGAGAVRYVPAWQVKLAVTEFIVTDEGKIEAPLIRDLALAAFESRRGNWDFLELQFATYISTNDRALIEFLTNALSKSWGARLPGIARKFQHRSRFTRARSKAEYRSTAILDVENPAGLSRSEYRICCLIQEGLAAKNIANQLNIQESTVRSHLHSIFSKTETSGQMELLHRLSRDQIGRGTSEAASA